MYNFLDYSKRPDLWKVSGKRIRERRKQLGYRSKDAFAEKISTLIPFKGESVGIWERGQAPINKVEQLGAVCQILECDPEYITCQCDTFRKENSDPVSRFGLSEESFKALEKETEEKQFTLNHGHEVDEEFGIVGKPYNHFYDTDIVDFILGNKDILSAFRYILDLKAEEAAKGRKNDRFDDFENLPSPLRDFFWRENAKKNQGLIIAEQQLIAEIRKALEK